MSRMLTALLTVLILPSLAAAKPGASSISIFSSGSATTV